MNKVNFHTHTARCHHAYGEDEAYVKSAIENHYKVLGFSDHACWNYKSSFIPKIRMTIAEFSDYKQSVLSLKAKYKDKIEIRLGMEAEYFPEYMDSLLDFVIEEEVDYLIFGNHFYRSDEMGFYYGRVPKNHIQDYFDDCVNGLKTGMYAYLAHPELILRDVEWDEEIEEGFRRVCMQAKELDLPLEYNVLGVQDNRRVGKEMYPNHHFWKLASSIGNKAIIGMDAHKPSDLDDDLYQYALQDLSNYNIEIVDEIPKINYRKLKEKKQEEK